MGDKSKVNKSNKSSPLSHADLLTSYEWNLIQSMRTRYGETPHTLAGMAPFLGTLLRRWDRQLPEAYHLPQVIQNLRDRVLLGRTFQKRPGSVPRFDRTAIVQYMHTLVVDKGLSVTAAAWKVCTHPDRRMRCTHGSAEKWYYAWRKTHAG